MEWRTIIKRDIPFASLEALQEECLQQVSDRGDLGFFIAAEPHPTFTKGRFADKSDLLFSEEALSQKGYSVAEVSRGGKWSYHGPGQVVIYPLFRLESLGYSRLSVKPYLIRLREGVSQFLTSRAVQHSFSNQPFGIYVSAGKVASFGIAVRGGKTSHGVALYLEPQAVPFSHIVPCGVAGERVSSLKTAGLIENWDNVAISLIDFIKKGLIRRHRATRVMRLPQSESINERSEQPPRKQ